MSLLSSEFDALRRIAEFSAELRGHRLADWESGESYAKAVCSACGREVVVHISLFQPDIAGDALAEYCGAKTEQAA